MNAVILMFANIAAPRAFIKVAQVCETEVQALRNIKI